MISGYVIFFSAQNRAAWQFALARAIRLYPAFLTCMIITATVLFFFNTGHQTLYLSQFLANFSMVPGIFGRSGIDGSYWTLSLEICFYSAIFIIIFFGLLPRLPFIIMTWPVLIFSASLLGGDRWPLVGGYYSYFAAGALFALQRFSGNAMAKFGLILSFYSAISFTAKFSLPAEANPIIVLLIPSSFFLFFWLLNIDALQELHLPFAKFFGNITYPLYLIHQAIGYLIIERFANQQNKGFVIFATMGFMCLIAFLIHFLAELKASNFSKKLLYALVGSPLRSLEQCKIYMFKAKSASADTFEKI